MIAYVPRERYEVRDDVRGNDKLNPDRRKEWKLCKDFGAIYNVGKNSSRPATSAEYKRRKSFKVMPDEVVGKPGPGRGAALSRLSVEDKVNNWTVIEILETPLRYKCECNCEHKTITVMKPATLLHGYSMGCQKCANKRKAAV